MKKDDKTEEERVIVLAEQVKNLLVFASLLIEDLDLLEKVAKQSADIQSHTQAMAPVFGAVGMDWEEKDMEAGLHRKRAVALVNLVKVIRDTEGERAEFKASQASKAEARAQLSQFLGI